MSVPMELARILIRETDDMHVVELREAGVDPADARVFPIVIGLHEAGAIERRLMGHTPPRPQTHELLENVIGDLGYQLERITISDLENHTFFAKLHLTNGDPGQAREIDARPSDAIALSIPGSTPIFVSEQVLEEVCGPEAGG
ncbi:MAG: bifunctional nuclease family protein [Planctomycetota bacterium]